MLFNHWIASFLMTALALVGSASAQQQGLKPLVVTEPVHGIGYLPLYVAMRKGFLADEGLDVRSFASVQDATTSCGEWRTVFQFRPATGPLKSRVVSTALLQV